MTPEEYKQLAAKRPRKYRNEPIRYNGMRYDSRIEADYAKLLDLQVRAGDIRGWIRQVPFELTRVDFLVFHTDGTVAAHEVKGVETARFKLVKRLWRTQGLCPLVIVRRRGEHFEHEVIQPREEE